jgi:hypothetical protein
LATRWGFPASAECRRIRGFADERSEPVRRFLVLFLLLTACAQTSPRTSTPANDQRRREALERMRREACIQARGTWKETSYGASCDVGGEEEPVYEEPSGTDDVAVDETATSAEPSKFSGIGKKLTKKFSIEGGLVTFQMSHQGSSNFAVTLLTAGGEYAELLANVIGDYMGERAFELGLDDYRMQVEADGSWKIDVQQPLHGSGELLPTTFSGQADGVAGPFEAMSGLVELKMNHKGSANFAVVVYSSFGEYIDLAANEIGNFKGSYGVSVEPGVYVMDVQADGKWKIALSE